MYWASSGSSGGTIYSVGSVTLSTDQNDYVVDFTKTIIRINATSNMVITGIDASTATDGQMIIISSVGTSRVRIREQNTGSSAANRFITGVGNIDLYTNGIAAFIYDATTQRWRLISTS